MVKARKEEVEKKSSLMVEIRPEFKAALQKSQLMDTVSAISNANIPRVLVEELMHCA